jgi:hypothetical protein
VLQLLHSDEFLSQLLMEGPERSRREAAFGVLRSLVWKDPEGTDVVLHAIFDGFEESNYFLYRSLFRMLDALLGITDEFARHRARTVVDRLVALLYSQFSFWKETDFVMEFTLRLCRAHRHARAALLQREHLHALEKYLLWLSHYGDAVPLNNKQGALKLHKPYRSLRYQHRHQVHTRSSTSDSHGLRVAEKERVVQNIVAHLKALPEGAGEDGDDAGGLHEVLPSAGENADVDVLDDVYEGDSDDDLDKRVLDVGTFVDVFDTDVTWLEGKVVEVEGGYVKINYVRYSSQFDEWVSMISPRIATAGSFKEHRPVYERHDYSYSGYNHPIGSRYG